MRASDLIIQCLENEDVRYVFGLPGEEILELFEKECERGGTKSQMREFLGRA